MLRWRTGEDSGVNRRRSNAPGSLLAAGGHASAHPALHLAGARVPRARVAPTQSAGITGCLQCLPCPTGKEAAQTHRGQAAVSLRADAGLVVPRMPDIRLPPAVQERYTITVIHAAMLANNHPAGLYVWGLSRHGIGEDFVRVYTTLAWISATLATLPHPLWSRGPYHVLL